MLHILNIQFPISNIKSLISKRAGFTLIELLVVTSLSVILLLVATSVLVTFLIGSAKNRATRQIKNDGNFALTTMSQQLRNSTQILQNTDGQTCETDMQKIAFRGLDGGITEFAIEDDNGSNKIASNSGNYLTPDSVQIINDTVTFDCVESPNGETAYVTISFGLRKGNPGVDRAYEVSEEYFTSGLTLRNY